MRYIYIYVGLGRDNLRSHFVFRPRHVPEWLHARFLPGVVLANKEELTGKIFTTSLNTTNPNTYVKFIFLRTSPLINCCSLQSWVAWSNFFRSDDLHNLHGYALKLMMFFFLWAHTKTKQQKRAHDHVALTWWNTDHHGTKYFFRGEKKKR